MNHIDNIILVWHEKNIKCVNFPQQTHTSSLYPTWVNSQAHLPGAYCLCISMHGFFLFLIHIFIVTEQWENGLPSATDCQLEAASITWSSSEERESGESRKKSSTERFPEFCSLPIIPWNNGCLSLVSGTVNKNECPSVLLFCT